MESDRIFKEVQRLAEYGKLDEAVAMLRPLIEADPTDLRSRLKMAELFVQSGERSKATAEFRSIAGAYRQRGFSTKSVSVLRVALEHDPQTAQLHLDLADDYLSLGLQRDALTHLRESADLSEAAGNMFVLVRVLERLHKLNPDDKTIPPRIRNARKNTIRSTT